MDSSLNLLFISKSISQHLFVEQTAAKHLNQIYATIRLYESTPEFPNKQGWLWLTKKRIWDGMTFCWAPLLQVFWVHLLVQEHGDVPDWPEDQRMLQDCSDGGLGSLQHPRQLHLRGPVLHRGARRQRGGAGVVGQEAGAQAWVFIFLFSFW